MINFFSLTIAFTMAASGFWSSLFSFHHHHRWPTPTPAPSPTATATATATAMPASHPLGIGIMYMIPTDSIDTPQRVPKETDKAFTNTLTQGVTCRTSWGRLEPHEHADANDFYWDFLDGCVNSAVATGKKFSIIVGDGVLTPLWVYYAGAQVFWVTESVGPPAVILPMPLPWDPIFQQKWGAMIHEVAARYGSNAQLAYVDLPIGHKVEGFFVQTQQDIDTFNSLGGLTIWKQGVEWKIDKMAAEFPHTPFTLDLGAPISTTDGQAALQAVCDYGVAHHAGNHFACSSHGLAYPNGPGSNSIGAKESMLLSSTTTPGFQTANTIGNGVDPQTGRTIVDLTLELATNWGGKFVEMRPADCDSPSSADALRTWGAYMTTH